MYNVQYKFEMKDSLMTCKIGLVQLVINLGSKKQNWVRSGVHLQGWRSGWIGLGLRIQMLQVVYYNKPKCVSLLYLAYLTFHLTMFWYLSQCFSESLSVTWYARTRASFICFSTSRRMEFISSWPEGLLNLLYILQETLPHASMASQLNHT